MPDQIFISYRRDDAAYVTGHINDLLRKEFGHESVFTDVDNIALGVDFRKVLDESVSQCQVFLAVIGDNWLTVKDHEGNRRLEDPADFVRIEVESALKRNIPIIPLLVGRATMPKAEELPEGLKDLAFRNGTQIRPAPDFNVDMDRLIKNLRRHLQTIREGAEGANSPAPKTPSPDDRRKQPPTAKSLHRRASDKKRNEPSGPKMLVGEDERARKQSELGIVQDPPKKRTGTLVAFVAFIAVAAGGWYYSSQNPEQFQSLLQSITGTGGTQEPNAGAEAATSRPSEPESEPEPDVGAPTSFGAPAVTATEDQVPAVVDGGASAARGASAEAASGDARELAGVETDGMVDGEVILTPGTQRQADVSGLISEGVSMAAVDDHDAAIEQFSDVLALDTEAAFVYRQRAASYQALGQHAAAVADYDEAIRINSEDVNAHYRRGASNVALGDYAAAVLDYDAVILLDPEFADAYSKRADAHEALGNTAQAAQDRATAAIFESNRQN